MRRTGRGSSFQRGVDSSASRTARSPYSSRKLASARRVGPSGTASSPTVDSRSRAAMRLRLAPGERRDVHDADARSGALDVADPARQRLDEMLRIERRHALQHRLERQVRSERAGGRRQHGRARSLEQRLDVAQPPRDAVVRQDREVERALRAPLPSRRSLRTSSRLRRGGAVRERDATPSSGAARRSRGGSRPPPVRRARRRRRRRRDRRACAGRGTAPARRSA